MHIVQTRIKRTKLKPFIQSDSIFHVESILLKLYIFYRGQNDVDDDECRYF